LQSAKPAAHAVMPHDPPLHATLACAGEPQSLPHDPQLLGSLDVFAHRAPQHASPGGHTPPGPHPPTHVPPLHVSPGAHALPHAPQFAGSDSTFTSQPFVTFRSQSAKPTSHLARAHALEVHSGSACGYGPHAMPHPPQSLTVLFVSTQNASQQLRPAGQLPPAPHAPTHLKSLQTSPLGHCDVVMHSTHSWTSTRQCGVGE
jgi:hypothetical protein